VTPQDIRLFLSQIGHPKPNSPGNRKDGIALIGRHWVALRSFFRWLCSEGILDSNPIAGIKAPKRVTRIVKGLSQEELVRLLDHCDTSPSCYSLEAVQNG